MRHNPNVAHSRVMQLQCDLVERLTGPQTINYNPAKHL